MFVKTLRLVSAVILISIIDSAPSSTVAYGSGSAVPYSEVHHQVLEDTVRAGDFLVVGDLVAPAAGEEHPVVVMVWGSGPAGRERMARPSSLVTVFLEAGYAVFIPDKPGTGASTGEFGRGRLLSQRSEILAAEVEHLRKTFGSSIPIGIYGSSQAAYVIAMAIERGLEIDFLVAVSCPAVSSVEQSAYLVERQMLCAGHSAAEAEKAREYFIQRHRALSYDEYLEAASFLDSIPVISEDLGWGGIVAREHFSPRGAGSEDFYDPGEVVSALDIPVLAVFAENDTQIDPRHGAAAFKAAMRRSASPLFRVVTIEGADHNMRRSETGCMSEQRERYGKPGGREYVPEFLEVTGAWLRELKARLK